VIFDVLGAFLLVGAFAGVMLLIRKWQYRASRAAR
jgi:hypothetical protein